MRTTRLLESEKGFYHVVTALICFLIIVVTACVLLVCYFIDVNRQDKTNAAVSKAEAYNEVYFSDRILNGVSVSGNDVGGMTVNQAKEFLSGNVDYTIDISKLVISFEGKEWEIDKDRFALSIDVDNAVKKAYGIGRTGTQEERREANEKLSNGGKIDISAISASDASFLRETLESIKKEIDIQKKDASVTFTYENGPKFSYTDEVTGRSLNVDKAYDEICKVIENTKHGVASYELTLEEVQPKIRRADIEKDYKLVGKYKTYISSTKNNRRNNITIALACFNGRVWMPGETLSFNQWVGERTAEKGFGNGVYINEEQLYDETMGGGICQVSTTIYYCALLCGANSQGQNAPIEITERRPHTWPSVYIDKGLDATISWPHTDLKMYNNSATPYFIRTYMTNTYVNVEIYGTPLPNNATVKIETEILEETSAGEPEYIEDKKNQYNLQPGQAKLIQAEHKGYVINVYQIWQEPGKEDIKSLITVSRYNPIPAKYYYGSGAAPIKEAAQPTG